MPPQERTEFNEGDRQFGKQSEAQIESPEFQVGDGTKGYTKLANDTATLANRGELPKAEVTPDGESIIFTENGRPYLQGRVEKTPADLSITPGVQSLEDVADLTGGIRQGLEDATINQPLDFLKRKDAVTDSLLSIGPALDNAVDYYTQTPPDQILEDATRAIGYIGKSVETTLGHPMTPKETGEKSGEAMAIFLPVGSKKLFSPAELEEMGGLAKLEKMTEPELEALGIRKIEDYGPRRLTKEALDLDEHYLTLDATQSMKDGCMTVNVDWLQTDKQANPFKLLEKLQNAAKAKGAQSLRIEGDIINNKLLNSRALSRFGTVTQEGDKTVITIKLGD